MKSLIQAVALAVVLTAPVASFAQSGGASASSQQATQVRANEPANAAQADSSGYGSGSHPAWQAGAATDTTLSSYSPPIYNVRRTYNAR